MVRLICLTLLLLPGCAGVLVVDPAGDCPEGSNVTVFTPVTGIDRIDECDTGAAT